MSVLTPINPPRPYVDDSLLAKKIEESQEARRHEWNEEACLQIAPAFLTRSGDGFCIAKQLERYEGWDSERDEMEGMDAGWSMFYRAEEELERECVESNSIAPLFKIGDSVTFKSHRGVERGLVSQIDKEKAKYIIQAENWDSGGKPIINFEQVAKVADE